MKSGKNEKEYYRERISEYAAGSLSREEAEKIERLMDEDPDFRSLVEEYRDAVEMGMEWLDAPAPGVEKAGSLPNPFDKEAEKGKTVTLPSWLRFGIAAAAVFVLGFLCGQWFRATPPQNVEPVSGVVERETTEVVPTPTPETTKPEKEKTHRRVVTENGRVVIETMADNARTRSLWVVDADLQIADSQVTE